MNPNSSEFPTQTREFLIALNVAVGITCLLSIIGAASIILSFIFFREIRTTGRFLLLNLSIADLITAVAVFTGASNSYKYIYANETHYPSMISICSFEPFFGLYGADSSILWTITLMAYLYVSLICCRPSVLVNRIIVTVSMLLCWGIPLPIVVTFLIKGFFGYEPGYSPGYCTTVTDNLSQIYRIVIGYWMFLYLSFVVLPILSFIFICSTRCKMTTSARYRYLGEHDAAIRAAEKKLLFVPIAFMLIRVWGLIDGSIVMYFPSDHYRHTNIGAFLVFITGIGNSAQGFVNGIFFWLLTPAVRYRVKLAYKLCCPCCPWKCSKSTSYVPTDVPCSYSNTCDGETVPVCSDRSFADVSADHFYGTIEH